MSPLVSLATLTIMVFFIALASTVSGLSYPAMLAGAALYLALRAQK